MPSLPKPSTASPRLQATRLMTLVKTEAELQRMLTQWEDNLLSGHIGRAVTKVEKDQRTLEKLFTTTMKQLLQLSRLRLDSAGVDSGWGNAAGSGIPGGNLLGQVLTQITRQALAPKKKTRMSETTRSAVAAERFAMGASDYGQSLTESQLRSARNR